MAAACGQKPGVADLTPSGFALQPDGTVVPAPGSGDATLTGSDGSTGVPGSAETVASASGVTATTESQGDAQNDPPPGKLQELIESDREPPGGSTDGLTDSTIRIGLHFPVTGAAPNPYAQITDWNLYWDHLVRRGIDIGGRRVVMSVLNDASDTSQAYSQCRELAEEDGKSFLLLGFANPGPIQACAAYANRNQIPYLSPGSSRYPLAAFSSYFSLSAPYVSQTSVGMKLFADKYGADTTSKNAVLTVKGGNQPDRQAFFRVVDRHDIAFEVIHTTDAQADPQQMSAVVLDLRRRGIKNIWFAGTPYHFLYFWRAASNYPDWKPRLMGPGVTVTVDGTLKLICTDLTEAAEGSLFLSPYRAHEDRLSIEPEFRRAVQAANADDHELHWWVWGISRAIHQLLEAPGKNLTRERFMWHAARSGPIETGVLPRIDYEVGQHFAEDSIHLLKANCDQKDSRWQTVRANIPLSSR